MLISQAGNSLSLMSNRKALESGCFVIDQSDLALKRNGCLQWAQVIGKDDAARKLSLFYLLAEPGESPVIKLEQGEAVLYLQEGDCSISISGREFLAAPATGIHVRRGETFSFSNQGGIDARWLLSICPRVEDLNFVDSPGSGFDNSYPDRTVSRSGREQHASGDRSYQLLVGPSIGSEAVTQFIGSIPRSRAKEHFHLYEEAICILSGHGRMWTGEKSAPVAPGSMIFLPRKQPHSLECLDDKGMELMGVFYPAGSPAINYET